MADPFFYNRNPSVLGEIGKKFSRTGTFFPQYKSLPRQIRQVYGGPARKRMGFPADKDHLILKNIFKYHILRLYIPLNHGNIQSPL